MCLKEVREGGQYKVYSDKGYSGSNLNRPAFQQMLKDIQSGMIDRIIVYRLDRISRSTLDFANLIDFLSQYGASFVSTQEKFDTGTPIGRAMLSITMVFAQLERETIQIRIKDNYYSRGEKGMYLGGPPPYGFRKTEGIIDGAKIKHLVPQIDEVQAIEMMFTSYGNERLSLGEIARRLNDEGFLSPRGKLWNSGRVGLTLRNPIYVRADYRVYEYYKNKGCVTTNDPAMFVGENGCYLYGKRSGNERKYTDVTDHTLSLAPSEGLVDANMFLKCQRKLDSNKSIDNSSWGTKTWLTGLVKCASCGYSLIPKSSNRGRYYYFYCSGRIINGCSESTHFSTIEELEIPVLEQIFEVAKKYSHLQVETQKKESRELSTLNAQIESYNEQISKLIELAVSAQETTSKYIDEKIKELDEKKTLAQTQIKRILSEKTEYSDKQISSLFNDWDKLNNKQRNELASLFIKRIDVTHEDIAIHWTYNFQ